MTGGGSVAHVMLDVGVRSETFVTNAIEAVEREGWESHVIGLNVRGDFTAVPPDRVHCTGTGTLLQRGTARLKGRSPERRFAEQALSYAKDRRIDLLHAHFGWAGNYAAPLAELLGVPLVVTFYGTDAAEPAGPYTALFRQTEHVIAVSDYVRQHLRALGYDGPVDLIRNGLPLGRLQMRPAPPRTDDGVRLLYVGRLVPVKGADVLLRAMPAIRAAHPDARLDIVGDGPERASIEAIASDLRLGGAVSFHGARDHGTVLETLRAAHVLVVPGRTMPGGQAETSSMVFKEALALGVPVAATASGGLPETCPPPFREELARPDDPLDLARAVISVLRAPEAWAARAQEGRRWVSERFNLERIGESLGRYYAAALRDHRDAHVAA
jgi:colanic acid/amylovoran biosynthesis glycosyltransferase